MKQKRNKGEPLPPLPLKKGDPTENPLAAESHFIQAAIFGLALVHKPLGLKTSVPAPLLSLQSVTLSTIDEENPDLATRWTHKLHHDKPELCFFWFVTVWHSVK